MPKAKSTLKPFQLDPNFVPDTQTTRGRSVSYEDTSFLVGDSPVVLDFNTDAGRNGRSGYLINDGLGSFTVEISDNGIDFGGVHVIKNGEILELDGADIDSIRISWVAANSSYRVFIV